MSREPSGGIGVRAAATTESFEVTKTDAEWGRLLSPVQYAILRQQATEPPGFSPLDRKTRGRRYDRAGVRIVLLLGEMRHGIDGSCKVATLPTASACVESPCWDGRSVPVDLDNSFSKRLRSFLRQIMPYAALDDPVRIFGREFVDVGAAIRVWCTIGIAFKRNCRDGDDRELGESFFQIVVVRLAFSQAEPPAIVMDDDANMIRVIECGSGAIKSSVIEGPLRGSELPNAFRKVVPVFVVAGPAAFGGKVILIPPFELSFWRQGILLASGLPIK